MNSIDKMLRTIDRLRLENKYDEAIEGLNLLRNTLNIEDNKFHNLIDSLIELCENEKNNSEREATYETEEPSEELIDVTRIFVVANFGGRKFAILKSDRLMIKKNPNLNVWINLYKIQNNSTSKNIMMSKSDMNEECGTFNPSTNKIRI